MEYTKVVKYWFILWIFLSCRKIVLPAQKLVNRTSSSTQAAQPPPPIGPDMISLQPGPNISTPVKVALPHTPGPSAQSFLIPAVSASLVAMTTSNWQQVGSPCQDIPSLCSADPRGPSISSRCTKSLTEQHKLVQRLGLPKSLCSLTLNWLQYLIFVLIGFGGEQAVRNEVLLVFA